VVVLVAVVVALIKKVAVPHGQQNIATMQNGEVGWVRTAANLVKQVAVVLQVIALIKKAHAPVGQEEDFAPTQNINHGWVRTAANLVKQVDNRVPGGIKRNLRY